MSVIWKVLKDQIAVNHDRRLNDMDIDRAARDGFFMSGNNKVSITKEVAIASQALADQIAGRINSLWDSGRDVNYLIFTGGGAPYVYDLMNYPNKLEVPNPFWANADGAFRFGLYKTYDRE